MQQPGPVHGRQRAAQVRADGGGFARAETALLLDEPMRACVPRMNSIQMPTRPSRGSAPYTVITLG